jgi:CRISPR-associated endonuclease/helicase Cas3
VADVVGARADEDEEDGEGRTAVRWDIDDIRVVSGADIRPGDTLVVPASRGGIRAGNWDPEAEDPVSDQGDLAQWRLRKRATLRLFPAVLAGGWHIDQSSAPPFSPDDAEADSSERIQGWLDSVAAGADGDLGEVLGVLRSRRRRREVAAGGEWVLVGRSGHGDASTEDDGASFVDREVSLARHSADVRAWAERFARSLGLCDALAADLSLAAWLHDVGKADPRFQQMLAGGSEVRLALLDGPIAKSAVPERDATARREARRRSRYPVGARHELLSVAMAERSTGALDRAQDRNLVLHLVGSHHGWCRPFAPTVDDPEDLIVVVKHGDHRLEATTRHALARLDSGVSDRFWDLVERYGWWGLAWLEALLRLADHRASEGAGS